MRYEVELYHVDAEIVINTIAFDFESELLDEVLSIVVKKFNEVVGDHEDLMEVGYKYFKTLNWFECWNNERNNMLYLKNVQTDREEIQTLIRHFNEYMEDNLKIEWVELKEDNRENLLDLTEYQFVNHINPFEDEFEFQFDNGYTKTMVLSNYLMDKSMEYHVLHLIKDEDKDIEKERSHYFYEWKFNEKTDDNMKWFWFVLGEITGGFDSTRYKILFK